MIKLTRDLAFAASLDAGNFSMSAAGRKTWDATDQAVAAREFQRLWPRCAHGIEPEELCYFCDQASLPTGHPLANKTLQHPLHVREVIFKKAPRSRPATAKLSLNLSGGE